MTPRQNKAPTAGTTPPPQEGTPKIETGVQEHHFGTQFAFDVNKQLGKLETGLKNVEDRLTRVETKLDQVAIDINTLTTTIGNYRPMVKYLAIGIWGVLAGIGAFTLTMLGYWLKHHFSL